jgi:phospholipid/cholesterol/gamma-HCH transport system permease protein
MIESLGKTGKNIRIFLQYFAGCGSLLFYSIGKCALLRKGPIRSVFYKQVYFTGIEALGNATIIGLVIGIVIIAEVKNFAGLNAVLTGKILIWTVVRELGPLFAAIIIIARSGTAISAELGSIKAKGEADSLVTMGIDPVDYLIVPRIAGITISVFLLAFYFQVVAIAGGLSSAALFFNMPLLQPVNSIFSVLTISELVFSLLKGLVFGMLISSISCYHGFRVKTSITEIPQAASMAVMQSLFLVLVFDGLIAFISFA